jgi:hypothetical protein
LTLTEDFVDGETYLRYATDPSGTWSSYHFSALTSPQMRQHPAEKVRFNGTHYYFVTVIYEGPNWTSRLEYATSPAGPWTTYNLTAGTERFIRDFRYLNGQYVSIGDDQTGLAEYVEVIGSSSTLVSTQTEPFRGASFTNGYSIDFDGTHYVKFCVPISGSLLQYSTTLGSGWTTPSTSFVGGSYGFNEHPRIRYLNGYWVALFTDMGVGTYPLLAYASDPTGTWTTVSAADTGFNYANGTIIWDIEYGGGYWVLCGGKPGTAGANRVTYLAAGAGAPPAGTFTVASTGLPSTSHVVPSVTYHNGVFALVSDTGQIKFSAVALVADAFLTTSPSPMASAVSRPPAAAARPNVRSHFRGASRGGR